MPLKVRLIKIASEINISKNTIVDFLLSRGFKVENKPTTLLDDTMQKLVYEKFKQERKKAEDQREKLQKRKEKKAELNAMVTDDNSEESTVIDAPKQQDNTAVSDPNAKDTTVVPTFNVDGDTDKKVENKSVFEKDIVEERSNDEKIKIDNIKKNTTELEKENINLQDNKNIQYKSQTKSKQEQKFQHKTKSKKKQNGSSQNHKEFNRMLTTNLGELIRDADNTASSEPIHLPNRIKLKIEAAKQQMIDDKKRKNKKNQNFNINQYNNKEKGSEEKVEIKTLENVDNKIKELKKDDVNNKDLKEKEGIILGDVSTNEVQYVSEIKDKENKNIDIAVKNEVKKEVVNREGNSPGDLTELKGLTVLGKINLTPIHINKDSKDKRQQRYSSKEHTDNSNKNKENKKNSRKNRGYRDNHRDSNDDNRELKDNNQQFKKGKDTDNRNYKNKDQVKKYRSGEIQSGDKKFISRDYNKKRENRENRENRDNINKDKNHQNHQNYQNHQKQKSKEKDTVYREKSSSQFTNKVFTDTPAQPAKVKNAIYAEKKRKKGALRETLSDKDVSRKIRETLSGMEDNFTSAKKSKIKQQKKAIREEKEARMLEITEHESHTLQLAEFVTTADLANLMNVKSNEIILKCMQLGLMVTINQRLDKDTILLIASDYGFEVEFGSDEEFKEIEAVQDKEEDLLPRPPIVTIMGHVDHGKTSLLDHIRNANVVAGEAGGITQHIGAYRVILKNGKSITFLDTPGHEAFTAMRARGAQVTDIVVLVVAADDNVMPQTIEAISHARAANVPVIIAINKIDRPNANPDKIKQQLADQGVLVEDWGGTHQSVEISAKKGINVDVLLDKILLEAEMLELKANPNRNANGIIIESKMTKGWGNVATVVILNGTLKSNDCFVAGANYGKTRALLDERGNKVFDVLPSQPAVVIGFDGLPEAGDTFNVIDSETRAREIANHRKQLRREQEMRSVRHITLDDISEQISIGGIKELFLVIKGDVAGSVEALSDSLQKLSTNEVRVHILHKSAGSITESDVMLASASKAVIIGFNTTVSSNTIKLAENENVEIRNYNIIYDCINEIQLALEGMLKPDIKEEVIGTVEVRKIFKIGRVGQIAGCYVLSGRIARNDKIRILRNGLPIHNSVLMSLKRNKDDVKEVEQNYECGIQIDGWNDFEENDIIEAYRIVEVKRSLKTN